METDWYNRAEAIQQRLTQLRDSLDLAGKLKQTAAIEERMAAADFWNNQEKAREAVAQLKALKALTRPLADVVKAADDLPAMLELAAGDEEFAGEVRTEIERLEHALDDLELKGLLNGPHDALGAIVSIYARDGGTDAHDWAEMMLRMYTQWSQKNGYDVTLIERQDNEEAGINSATIAIRGPMAYGYLKGETGIHRLVRISPFNSEGKRQTSFAAVDVSPEVSDDIDIQVDWDKDVREETMRAGGAGGQHVNKTESAIRLVHLSTGIEVKCQNERSQHQNRAMARKLLISRLVRREEERREAESAARYKTQAKVGFGSQIRNYFLHPSQRVKDSRTGYLEHNFHNVLDGNLQGFFDSYLKWRVKGELAGAVGDEE
ncbi:MAG: peptide chain release factor 2 [Planctomycetaceae bacterium]|nr:peptide chain release factor 2 [Planctomycetaceae bacterium]